MEWSWNGSTRHPRCALISAPRSIPLWPSECASSNIVSCAFRSVWLDVPGTRRASFDSRMEGTMTFRAWIGIVSALLVFSGALNRTASAAENRTLTILCTVTPSFFTYTGDVCQDSNNNTRWVFLVTSQGDTLSPSFSSALLGQKIRIGCAISNTASAWDVFHWQQYPGGFYQGAIHPKYKPFATFVNGFAAIDAVGTPAKIVDIKAMCTLFSPALIGIPADSIVKKILLHLD